MGRGVRGVGEQSHCQKEEQGNGLAGEGDDGGVWFKFKPRERARSSTLWVVDLVVLKDAVGQGVREVGEQSHCQKEEQGNGLAVEGEDGGVCGSSSNQGGGTAEEDEESQRVFNDSKT